ncbi:asparaginase [Jhaorihella thermophila]|uniref:Asparaginase n=1 Tax=Jhaorihella thermophila TaxID=488547 RepID=A0A1H5XQG4_9RHOB|nr:asparaginase [Jhaorihella thermophila]SEG13912.1 asparaginase [Jhaorihella thermophila]
MTQPVPLAEIWRGPFLESLHLGHAVICDDTGQIVHAWGDPQALIYPRSSCKMVQALPLMTSGAADAFGLTDEQLALACASHNGAAIHTRRVQAWLDDLGLGDDDLRCGPQEPADIEERNRLIRAEQSPCQYHNNCSGKHSGFLTLAKHLGAGPDYIDIDHPVQKAVREAFEEVTAEDSPGYGIDGCSAPNFATTLHGLARAMAWFSSAHDRSDTASRVAARLVRAMMTHPELVAGKGRACTVLMRAAAGQAAVKTGAEAVFVGILPERRMGIALKIADGGTRGAECAIASLLVALGILDANDPAVRKWMNAPILNRRGIETGSIRPAGTLPRKL